jgi:hypothetical protein
VFGGFNLSSAIGLFKEVLDECSQTRCTKILIDVRTLEYAPSATDSYVFGNMIPILQKKRAFKVAFVTDPDRIRQDRPVEREATAAGAQVKVVPNLDEAYAWLGVEGK